MGDFEKRDGSDANRARIVTRLTVGEPPVPLNGNQMVETKIEDRKIAAKVADANAKIAKNVAHTEAAVVEKSRVQKVIDAWLERFGLKPKS